GDTGEPGSAGRTDAGGEMGNQGGVGRFLATARHQYPHRLSPTVILPIAGAVRSWPALPFGLVGQERGPAGAGGRREGQHGGGERPKVACRGGFGVNCTELCSAGLWPGWTSGDCSGGSLQRVFRSQSLVWVPGFTS